MGAHTTIDGMIYHSHTTLCRAWLTGGYDSENCASCAKAARQEGCPECGQLKPPSKPHPSWLAEQAKA